MTTDISVKDETFSSSEQVDQLITALCGFHAEFKDVEKTGNNPFYKSSYVTKSALVEETRQLLSKHGLVVIQGMFGKNRVITRIYHKSGQWLETSSFEFPRIKEDPHTIASAITYFSRQGLMSALYVGGIDDDGNAAKEAFDKQAKVNVR